MPSPIFPYPGGKRRLAKSILPLFPDHRCYVEPFCGGAALLFMRDAPARVEVINDANGELVNLYRVVKTHLQEFIAQLHWSLSSRQMFKWLQMTNTEPLTDIQRAARWFYLQRHAFGGKVVGQTFGVSASSPGVNLGRVEEALSDAFVRLSGVTIEHLHWSECVRRYDRPYTLFFCDPPYWQTAGYGIDFGWSEYVALVEQLATIKGRAIMTINDHPDIVELLRSQPGWRVDAVDVDYKVGGGHKAKAVRELIVRTW